MTEAPEPQAWKHAINGRGRQQAAKSPTDWRKLEAPFYYAANVQILISGNDATLLFTRPLQWSSRTARYLRRLCESRLQ